MIALLQASVEWGAITAMCGVVALVCAGGAIYVRYVVRDEITRLDDRYITRREFEQLHRIHKDNPA